ncbi:MAG: hypothetical protein Q9M12_08595 [Mariprofundus sp.]|nr:hypothetical protein [Mariprofundus sp.]
MNNRVNNLCRNETWPSPGQTMTIGSGLFRSTLNKPNDLENNHD